jgi:hypothetical protein
VVHKAKKTTIVMLKAKKPAIPKSPRKQVLKKVLVVEEVVEEVVLKNRYGREIVLPIYFK